MAGVFVALTFLSLKAIFVGVSRCVHCAATVCRVAWCVVLHGAAVSDEVLNEQHLTLLLRERFTIGL